MRIERPRQVLEEDKLGKKIAHVQFGMFGNEEVERLAEFEVTSDRGYEQPGRIPVSNGVLDRRLGISDKHNSCETCGMRMQDCPGHFGYIRLELPVLLHCADPCVPGPPYCTYRLRVPTSCVLYVPGGTGQLVRHGAYAVHVPASGVPCVPRTVWCTKGDVQHLWSEASHHHSHPFHRL